MRNVILVFIGGGLGSVLRYGTVLGLARLTAGSAFPWSIFVANLLGSFVLGFLFGLPSMKTRDSAAWFFCATGVLGGYTTFSGFALEVFRMIENGKAAQAIVYLGATNSLCVFLAFAGLKLGRALQ